MIKIFLLIISILILTTKFSNSANSTYSCEYNKGFNFTENEITNVGSFLIPRKFLIKKFNDHVTIKNALSEKKTKLIQYRKHRTDSESELANSYAGIHYFTSDVDMNLFLFEKLETKSYMARIVIPLGMELSFATYKCYNIDF